MSRTKGCEACQRLQQYKPGGRCFDCQSFTAGARQLKTDIVRYCRVDDCSRARKRIPLPETHRYFCPECHERLSGQVASNAGDYQIVIQKPQNGQVQV